MRQFFRTFFSIIVRKCLPPRGSFYGIHETVIGFRICTTNRAACPRTRVRETMSKPQVVYTCRFCLKSQEGKHMTALFTANSIKKEFPIVLSSVFAVPVVVDDGYSTHCCRYCIASAISLHNKLSKLREMAKTSYGTVHRATGIAYGLYNCSLSSCHSFWHRSRAIKETQRY